MKIPTTYYGEKPVYDVYDQKPRIEDYQKERSNKNEKSASKVSKRGPSNR